MSAGTKLDSLGSVLSDAHCGIFIINLDRRADRWVRISEHLRELNCHSFQRIAACDGLMESKELAKKVFVPDNEKLSAAEPTKRQMGALGCLKSHLKALKVASERFDAINIALILEDDCFFIDKAPNIVKRSLDELPSEWKFLMLGAVYGSAPGFIPKKNHVMRVYNATAAHAYIVNRHSCQLLIERIEALLEAKTIFPIDEWFTRYQSTEDWYATNPLIAGQRSGDYSDIEGMNRVHTDSCFKLGIIINRKIWLWMKMRRVLPIELMVGILSRISAVWRWALVAGEYKRAAAAHR